MPERAPTELVGIFDRLSRRFLACETVEALAETAFEAVRELVEVEYSGFFFIDPDDGVLKLYCTAGFTPEEAVAAERSAWDRHPGWVLRTGQALHVPDERDPHPEVRTTTSPRSFTILSRLYLPVLCDGRAVGALGLGSPRPRAFSEQDIGVVSYAAGLAGLAYGRLALRADLGRAERERDDLLARLEAITTNARDAIVMLDERGRISFWNPAAVELFGYPAQEMLGRELHQLVMDPAQRERYAAGMRTFATTGEGEVVGRRLELDAITRQGETVPVELSVAAVRLGHSWYAVGIARDISAQRRFTAELERQVAERTSELVRVNELLNAEVEERAQLEARLRALAERLVETEAKERRALAQALHDKVGQSLSFCQMKLLVLEPQLAHSEQAGDLSQLREALEAAIQDVRTLTVDLSPPVLYELGLGAALEWLAERVQRRHGLAVHLVSRPPVPLPVPVRVLAFQITRELLINVVKHARANLVLLRCGLRDGRLRIGVLDDGFGMDAEVALTASWGGFGLFSIRERLRTLDGTLSIQSHFGEGCSVSFTIPLPADEE